MRNDPSTVGIAPGDGLIARFGAVVVYLASETPSTDRILGAIEAVADARYPGAAIAQRLAAVVFGGNSEPSPFGVIAPTADGTVILLRGQVSAEIQGAEGTRRLSGARAFTWVDEIVQEPVRRIAVGADTAFPIHELPRTDLRAGIIPGNGFVLRIAARRIGKSTATRARTTGTPAPAAEPQSTAAAGSEARNEATAKSEPIPTGQRVGTPRPAGSAPAEGCTQGAGFAREAESARPTGSVREPSAQSTDPSEPTEKGRSASEMHPPGSSQRSAAHGPTAKAEPTGSIHTGRTQQRSAADARPTEEAGPPETTHSGRSPQQSIADSAEPIEKAGSTDAGRSTPGSPARAVGFDESTDKVGPAGSPAVARPGATSSEARASGSAPSGGSGQASAPEEIGTQAMSAQERAEAAGTQAEVAVRPEPIALHKIPALHGLRPRPLRPIGSANNTENSGAGQPVGTLVLADGTAYPLDRPYVVGRSPAMDETVRAATATPLAVPRDRHVSRVHAYVSVDRGKVYVRDAATPAGTFIAAPGADEWTRIGTTPTELHPGWSLRIGQRILTYRTDDGPKHPTRATSKRRRP
ncbi:FHA domain-containing protein [Nocardia sp. NPDC051990]|uniref:FHA domain-containing protein n=1 Tax=Nocardia sp. NPDC051990 TaxID=3155285 RepID=UPI003428915F